MKIFCFVDEKHHKGILKNAKGVGLDKIDYNKSYDFYKIRSKHSSRSQEGYVIRGSVVLLGIDKVVWIMVSGTNNWYKTSPILSCTPIENGFNIETENSFYELRNV
jgi:hypothetical protein